MNSSTDAQSASPQGGHPICPMSSPSPLLQGGVSASSEAGISHAPDAEKGVSKETELRLKYADEMHQYIREYIRLADQKAAFFFAVSAGVIAYLNSKGFMVAWLVPLCDWSGVEFLSFASVVLFCASAVSSFLTVKPRLAGSAKGVVFFNAVSSYETQQEYAKVVALLSPASLCEEKLKHVYEIAKVCRRKYQSLFYAIWFGGIGLASTVALVICAGKI